MNSFLAEILADIPLTKDIEKLYGHGPLQEKDERRRNTYAEYKFKLVENDDYKQCDNLILKVMLFRGPIPKGKQSKVLFHISLHPKLPQYVRDTRRSRSGCGFYKKTPANAAAAGADIPEDTNSPFGYAIESIDWDGPLMTAMNENRPWLPLLVDPRDPGTFRRNTARFETLFKEDFTDGRDSKTPLPDLELVNKVHKAIYNKFIDSWNNVWVPGVAARSSPAGELLEESLPRLRKYAPASSSGESSASAGRNVRRNNRPELLPANMGGGTRKRHRRRAKKTRRSIAHKH